MYNANDCYGANNYNDILYFLSNTTIHPHIDRIFFSCRSDIDKPEETLFSVLKKENYKCKSDGFAKGKVYKRIRIFKSRITGVNVSILYGRNKRYSYYPCMGITIYKPDTNTIDWFDAICNSLVTCPRCLYHL